jgi:hypothetical protein
MPAVLRWQFGAQEVEKEVMITKDAAAFVLVSSRRPGAGWWDRMLYPGEDALSAASPVRGITIYHEQRSTRIMGRDFPGWLMLIVVSIVAALVMRSLVRVPFWGYDRY